MPIWIDCVMRSVSKTSSADEPREHGGFSQIDRPGYGTPDKVVLLPVQLSRDQPPPSEVRSQ